MPVIETLSSDDFLIETKGGGVPSVLRLNVMGFALVLFYSPINCEPSRRMVPVFQNVAQTFFGCRFGMVNVTTEPQLISSSAQTTTHITFVPYILFYNNTIPFSRYQGQIDPQALKSFLASCSSRCKGAFMNPQINKSVVQQQQQPFRQTQHAKKHREPCPFSLGIPKLSDDESVSYLTFDQINGNVNIQQRHNLAYQGP